MISSLICAFNSTITIEEWTQNDMKNVDIAKSPDSWIETRYQDYKM